MTHNEEGGAGRLRTHMIYGRKNGEESYLSDEIEKIDDRTREREGLKRKKRNAKNRKTWKAIISQSRDT